MLLCVVYKLLNNQYLGFSLSNLFQNKMVASLIAAYNIHSGMTCIESVPATDEELMTFHSSAYIEFLKECEREQLELETSFENDFGLGKLILCSKLDYILLKSQILDNIINNTTFFDIFLVYMSI